MLHRITSATGTIPLLLNVFHYLLCIIVFYYNWRKSKLEIIQYEYSVTIIEKFLSGQTKDEYGEHTATKIIRFSEEEKNIEELKSISNSIECTLEMSYSFIW